VSTAFGSANDRTPAFRAHGAAFRRTLIDPATLGGHHFMRQPPTVTPATGSSIPDDATSPLIQLDGITKVFLTDEVETHALGGVNLEIRQGEYVAIAGPSGGGKTTLLSILGLLETPTEGTYTLAGEAVASLSATERARVRNRQIGFIFQAFNLIGDLTVYENVELPLTYRGMSGSERHRRVAEALERVGMAQRTKHYPAQLSGGQQQRVAVARAVAGDPAILLADEPTGNLDSQNGEAVMTLLGELHRQGATICMVTHDSHYAQHAERSIRIFDGRIVEEERRRRAGREPLHDAGGQGRVVALGADSGQN
jgi:putative ABC transport system ATP-binding protein